VKQAQENPEEVGKVRGFLIALAEGYAKGKGALYGTIACAFLAAKLAYKLIGYVYTT